MQRFRKKPVIVEVVQWTGHNLDEVLSFCPTAKPDADYVIINTLEDGPDAQVVHVASKGDYIIKGVKGEFYPCKPDIFEETYEPA
jgi:hypothetical protein